MAQKLISKSFKMEKGCHVKSIRLDSVKRQADISYDCGGGGSGSFPTPEGGSSNYPKARVKGVREVAVAGSHVSGQHVSIGFELSQRYVKCEKRAFDTKLTCHLFNSAGLLAGARRRRR